MLSVSKTNTKNWGENSSLVIINYISFLHCRNEMIFLILSFFKKKFKSRVDNSSSM